MQALFNLSSAAFSLLPLDLFSIDATGWASGAMVLFLKGLLILGATGLIAFALRKSAAAIRYMVWCAGLLSLMLLPVLSSALPAWELEMLAGTRINSELTTPLPFNEAGRSFDAAPSYYPQKLFPPDTAMPSAARVAPLAAEPLAAQPSVFVQALSFIGADRWHWTTWTLLIWAIGAFMILGRLVLAHIGTWLLVRNAEIVHEDEWHLLAESVQQRLGIEQRVKLRKSSWTSVPMNIGVWRPVVVLPENANEWDEAQRHTVMMHELAHVKRRDCFLQLLTNITSALHWFNPMVWVAGWQLRIERERACDDLVITSGASPALYAETLLQAARQLKKAEWSTVAAVSMARQSQLEGRLLSILDPVRRRDLNGASRMVVLGVIAAIVLPLAVMQPVNAQVKRGATPPVVAVSPVPPVAPVLPPDFDVDIPAFDVVVPEINIDIPEINIPAFNIHIPEIKVDIPPINIPEFDIDIPPMHFDWEGDFSEPGTPVDSLSIDQIIQLRKYGVDAAFIRELKALGFDDLTYRDLISLGKYGADADDIRAFRAAGLTNLSLQDYAMMSKYGVDEDFVAAMQQAGYRNLSADDLVAMSKYGVDEDLIETLAQNGYNNLSIDDLVTASKYGLDEDLIESISTAGYDNISLQDLISMSKYGVDEDLIGALRSYGYDNLSADDLIHASKYGIDEDMIEAVQAYGFEDVSLDEIISMHKYGVDEDYLEEMAELGADVSIDELIRMRKYGVDAEYIQEMIDAGVMETVLVDQLIDMRKHGVDAEFIKEMQDN